MKRRVLPDDTADEQQNDGVFREADTGGTHMFAQQNHARQLRAVQKEHPRQHSPIHEIGGKDAAHLLGEIEHIEAEHHAAHAVQGFVDKGNDELYKQQNAVYDDRSDLRRHDENDHGDAENESDVDPPKGGKHPSPITEKEMISKITAVVAYKSA